MFGKLPTLFDKNFAIGFFLPSVIFLTMLLWLFERYGILQQAVKFNTANEVELLIGTTTIGLLSWVGGILLLALNQDIIRFFEGYNDWNLLKALAKREEHRFDALVTEIAVLDDEYRVVLKKGREFSAEKREQRNKLMRRRVEEFPDDKRWLLPTALGNTIRAFEVYPRIMYGIDAIPSWDRLLGVVDKEYALLINDAKAIMDFWLNLLALTLLFALLEIGFAVYTLATYTQSISAFPFPSLSSIIFLIVSLITIVAVAWFRALSAARAWGALVKAAYDLYLPALQKKLGFTGENSRGMWKRYTQAVLYGRPDLMPERESIDNVEDDKSVK